jgi:hypothetical protein
VKKKYAEMEPFIRELFEHCGSICIIKDIEKVSQQDITRVIEMIDRLGGVEKVKAGPLYMKLKIFFHTSQGDIEWAIRMINKVETADDLDRVMIMGFRRKALEPPGPFVHVNSDLARATPGVATGGEHLPPVTNGREWLRQAEGGVGLIPEEIASKLRGQQFKSWEDFREKFWAAVGDSTILTEDFSPSAVTTMKGMGAPASGGPKGGALGGRFRYELHHITPIENGGGVYDLDNIVVVSPRTHVDIHAGTNVTSPLNKKPVTPVGAAQ